MTTGYQWWEQCCSVGPFSSIWLIFSEKYITAHQLSSCLKLNKWGCTKHKFSCIFSLQAILSLYSVFVLSLYDVFVWSLRVQIVCSNCMNTLCMFKLYVLFVCSNCIFKLYVLFVCSNCMFSLYVPFICSLYAQIVCSLDMFKLYVFFNQSVLFVCSNCTFSLYVLDFSVQYSFGLGML